MRRNDIRNLLRTVTFAGLLILAAPPPALTSTVVVKRHLRAGVVVEEVGSGSAGEKAGIEPGDVLLEWSRAANPPANPAPARGAFRSPFDVREIELEQADRGSVALTVRRGDKKLSYAVPPGSWDIKVRPDFAGETLVAFEKASALEEDGNLEKATIVWRDLAARSSHSGAHELAAWLYWRAGTTILRGVNCTDEAANSYREAIREGVMTRQWRVQAQLWDALAWLPAVRAASLKADSRARELRESHEPVSLATAFSLANSAATRTETRTELLLKALRIRETLAPGSLAVRLNLEWLGVEAYSKGDLDEAETLFSRSLEISDRLMPDSLLVAETLEFLGWVAQKRNDLPTAERFLRKAIAIREQLGSKGDLASHLNSLGRVLLQRGNAVGAYDCYSHALTIEKTLSGGATANTLSSLGWISLLLENFDRAESLLGQALKEHERTATPPELRAWHLGGSAGIRLQLGLVALSRGRLDSAEKLLSESARFCEQSADDNCLASALLILGRTLERKGELSAAQDALERAYGARQRQAADSLDAIGDLIRVGQLAGSQGHYRAAEGFLTKALALIEGVAPGIGRDAMPLNLLASYCWSQGRFAEAEEYFRGAVNALEVRRGKLTGGSRAKTEFGAEYYRDYVETLVNLASVSPLRPDQDFLEILERWKARSLLDMLAERDLDLSADLPHDLQIGRRQADRDYEWVQSRLSSLSPQRDAEKVERLLLGLQQLRGRQEGIAERIKKASPRFASLRYPQPLNTERVQTSLDRGTLLLSYVVGRDRSLLFVVSSACTWGSGARIFSLPLGEADLRQSVEAFRNMIGRRAPQGQGFNLNLLSRSRFLYDVLIKPAEEAMVQSDRLLIIPDGPLHTLPWAALIRDVKGGKPQYLVEWKPLHTAISATVYAELKRRPRPQARSSPILVAAFGDPNYPKLGAKEHDKRGEEGEPVIAGSEQAPVSEDEELADPQVRSAVQRGVRLEPGVDPVSWWS